MRIQDTLHLQHAAIGQLVMDKVAAPHMVGASHQGHVSLCPSDRKDCAEQTLIRAPAGVPVQQVALAQVNSAFVYPQIEDGESVEYLDGAT